MILNNDEFVKIIKKYGKIKPVEEAFKEYPVEEEEHKGKIEAYLHIAEENEKYSIPYKIGDIVFVKNYQYENGTYGKNHLFVIIGENNLAIPMDYLGMLISSKINKQRFKENKLLPKDEKNQLNVDSIVKTDVIYQIKNDEIVLKIGVVDKEKIEEYKQSYIENKKF